MKTAIIAVMALCAAAGSASAQDKAGPSNPAINYSVSLTTTAVQVLPDAGGVRQWLRIINEGATSQGTAWCSRSLGANVAPHTAGAFALAPFGNALGEPSTEEFSNPSHFVPSSSLWCVSDGATVPLTAEASPR